MPARFLALHGEKPPSGPYPHMQWVNVDHISWLEPRFSGIEPELHLHARLKVEGMPIIDSWIASVATRAEAETKWQEFLSFIEGESEPSESSGWGSRPSALGQ